MEYTKVYWRQKTHAKQRGIEFYLSFSEWREWWGEDIINRGRGPGKLQMCRKNDTGPYSVDNIYKATHNQNSSDKFKYGFKARKKSLDEDTIGLIRKDLNQGISTRKLAEKYNVSQRTIMRVKLKTNSYKE